jgi:hypothetical protein
MSYRPGFGILASGIVAGTILVAGSATASVEYALSYVAVPAEVVWAERQAKTNESKFLPPILNPLNEKVRFGSLGFRLGTGLPARLGPFSVGVEAGLGVSAGSQRFEHTRLVKLYPEVTSYNSNDLKVGDLTIWEVMTVPILFRLRYSPPTTGISLGGQVGVGPVLLGLTTERTESRYAGAVMQQHTTRQDQDLMLSVGVELTGGILVPLSETLSLDLFGGLFWMSETRSTTTDNSGIPIVVYGASPTEPGLKLGGLGYVLRAGFSLTI